MNDINDDSLYGLFLKGDNSAYDKLMIKYGDALTTYLKGFLYSWEDAEDLMIEAFARIMVKKPRIEAGNFKAYLYRTAHNLVAHFYKKDKRRKVFSLEDFENLKTENGKDLAEPKYDAALYEKIWDDERKRIIKKCLERLGEEMREALWLFYFDELSYKETASVMNVSNKKIDNLLTRGRKCLKEELEKEGITDAFG
ncbi:MAG: RNA polymerase sigma factor [Lachnospiraceae bacterium]|nr:RNA polymerase sigma factor [Lachnospiraceae bacterium]